MGRKFEQKRKADWAKKKKQIRSDRKCKRLKNRQVTLESIRSFSSIYK